MIAKVGVEPGPVQHTEGATAVLADREGTVELRRLGEEGFVAIDESEPLYQGDQLRAGDGARATVLFPDESTVELAEGSTLAIGSRVATADPASSAAVLEGVARFSVSPNDGPSPLPMSTVMCLGASPTPWIARSATAPIGSLTVVTLRPSRRVVRRA